MRIILIGIAALALAAPAGAQRVFTPEMDEELVRSIPAPEEIEATGQAIDAVVGAVLDMPIGPIVDAIDAADPEGRRYRRHSRHDTVRDVAGRDDPYFEERLRDGIYGVTAGIGMMAEQLAVIAPEMRRALGQVERDVDRAIRDARERRDRDRRR